MAKDKVEDVKHHGRQEGRKPAPEDSAVTPPRKPEDHGLPQGQFPGVPQGAGDADREPARPKDTGRSGA